MKYFHKTGPASAGIAFGSSPHCAALAVGMFFTFLGQAEAATINAASPSFVNVSTAIALAVDGDTVIVPAGTASWTSTLTVTKGITLIGQTTVDPTINPTTGSPANDQTIVNVGTGTNGNTPLIVLNIASGKFCRLSGITFATGQTTAVNANGMIQIKGNSQTCRIDHCHFNDLVKENTTLNATDYCVVDHNFFDFRTASGTAIFVTYAGVFWGDEAWTLPARFGSNQFVFIEDNCFRNARPTGFGGGIDDRQGGRWVLRHNHFYDIPPVGSHGTEIGRYRGGRAVEFYNNDLHFTFGANIGGIRSGGYLTHDNTFDGVQPQHGVTLGQYRVFFPVPVWGGSWGDNPWDYNVTESDGVTHVDGHSPYLFDSGTAGTGSNQTTIVDTTKTWTTNQWVGYTAKRPSDGGIMIILSNTSNTITGYYHPDYGGGTTWAAGNQYQIHRVLISTDQPCRGAGDLVTGGSGTTNGVNATTGTQSWTHQALEPAYSWNDIYTPNNSRVDISLAIGAFAILKEGRDFYNNTPMPGYTPYTYPHPLVSAATPTPAAPTNLRVTGP